MAVQLVSVEHVANLESQLRYWLIQHAIPDGEPVSITDLIELKNAFLTQTGSMTELNRVVREAELEAAKICLQTEIPPYEPEEIKPSPELAQWLETKTNARKKEERRRKRRKERHRDRVTLRRHYPVPASAYAYCK